MPWFKMEINFKAESERDAMKVESYCYHIVKDHVEKTDDITMDMVFEIPEEDKDK
jgi:hypothetical protein